MTGDLEKYIEWMARAEAAEKALEELRRDLNEMLRENAAEGVKPPEENKNLREALEEVRDTALEEAAKVAGPDENEAWERAAIWASNEIKRRIRALKEGK